MKEKRTSELIGSVVGNLIGIAFFNTVLLWRQYTNGVVLETWANILWAANLSLIVQIAGNVVLALYRPARFYAFIQAVHSAVGLLSVIVFYVVFPLDFSQIGAGWLNTLLRVVLIIGMAATAISIVVNLVRAVAGVEYSIVDDR